MSSEVPKWLEDAVRKCKEGDDRACEIVRKYIDYLMSTCLNVRTEIFVFVLLTILNTSISLILRLTIMQFLTVLAIFVAPLSYVLYLYWSSSKILEYLCGRYIDPPMFTRDAKIYIWMTITTIIICIIMYIIATIFK